MSDLVSRFAAWLGGPQGRAEGARPWATALCTAAVVLVALADLATGPDLAFGIFYLVPVVAVTIAAGTTEGLVLAFAAAMPWVIADDVSPGEDPDVLVLAMNIPLRFGILALIVLLLGALRGRQEQVEESERVAREFLSAAAHQLRTPVATVQATADALLLSDKVDRRLLANLSGEAARMGRLVNSLLRLARLDQLPAGEPEVFSPMALCTAEADRFSDPGVVPCVVRGGDDVPTTVVGPMGALREALANVVDNARGHAHSEVVVHVEHRRDELVVKVGDDGPGVPEGNEESVFARFVSYDDRGGSGLGLAIARQALRRHGGDVVYERPHFVLSVPVLPSGEPEET